MALVLTISDDADGTGGTATIAGSLGGTNTLYRSEFDGDFGAYDWTSTGSRSGDGTIDVTTPGSGLFLWIVGNSGGIGGFSNAVYQSFTNATTQSVLDRILDAVLVRVAALNLAGVESTSVLRRWQPRVWEGVDVLPAVRIAPGAAPRDLSVVMARDDVAYPVTVAVIAAANQDYESNETRNLLWWQRIDRALRFQRLAGVAEAFNCVPDRGPVVHPDAWANNRHVEQWTFWYAAREVRGLS